MQMRLKTLGDLALEGSVFNRFKPLLLLSYLAMEGPTSRRELSDLFFMGSKNPRDSLSTALRYLRRESDDLLHVRSGVLEARAACDASELLALLDGGQLLQATGLYEGPFLKGLDLALGSELEEWVFATRELLADRVRTAYLDLAEGRLREGNSWDAGRLADKAYACPGATEPEPEALQRLYPLLVAAGSAYAAELRKEAEGFGLTLTSEVQVEAGEAPEKRATGAFQVSRTNFVGRRTELVQLTELLERPEVTVVTLQGSGGVGKSRLAQELAAGYATSERFRDGVYYVSLDGLNAATQIPTAIAGALGVDVAAHPNPVLQIRAHLQGKTCLLVLDNYEHVIEGSTVPAALVAGRPELRIVATSRERLGIDEEHLFHVEGLRVPDANASLEEAAAADAVRLFEQRARKARSSFRLTRASLASVLRICAYVQGSPLAIELAAAWVRVMPAEQIAHEIERDLDFFTSASRNVPDRQRSMRTVLEQSWNLLTPKERGVLARLSVFRGGFQRGAASAVADASLLMLARFIDTSILHVVDGNRYEAHPLLLQYARERLGRDRSARDEAERRHCAYFVRFLEARAASTTPEAAHRVFTEVDAEIHDVLAAADMAREGDLPRDLVTIARLLWVDTRYFASRGADAYALSLLEEAAQAATVLGEIDTAHDLYGKLGDTCQNALGDFGRALAAYEKARGLARSAGNTGREAVFLSLYGVVRHRQGRDDAESYLERAYELARAVEDDLSLCAVLEQRGLVFTLDEQWLRARDLFQESLAVVERLEQDELALPAEIARRRYFALLNLGEPEHRLGRFDEALELRSRALEIAEHYGNQIWAAHALLEVGQMLAGAGRIREAEPLLNRALALYTRNRVHANIESLTAFMEAKGCAPSPNPSPIDPPQATSMLPSIRLRLDRPEDD